MIEIKNNYPSLEIKWVEIHGANVDKAPCYLLEKAEEEAKKIWTPEKLLENPIIRAYRDFFWEIGIDPTKERPSSEALIRRILKGKKIYRVNNAVDAMNAASIETLITLGLLDIDKFKTPLILRPAETGEKMVIIGGKEITVPSGFPVIEDGEGVIISATIYRDGEIAKITTETKNMVLIGYAPQGIEKKILVESTKKAENYIKLCTGITRKI